MTAFHEKQIEALRAMSPAKKLDLIAEIHLQARAWKKAALRQQHPDWSNAEIEKTTRDLFFRETK